MQAHALSRADAFMLDGSVGGLGDRLQRSTPEEAGQKMEALFATMLVKELRRTLPTGFFGDSSGADTFNGWLDEHLGNALAESGALDLAGMVKASLAQTTTGDEG